MCILTTKVDHVYKAVRRSVICSFGIGLLTYKTYEIEWLHTLHPRTKNIAHLNHTSEYSHQGCHANFFNKRTTHSNWLS
jgi:hypothetical protein